MKILYCIPWLYNAGGMERTLTTKVNYLVANLGYEVTIVTTEQFGRPVFFELDKHVKLIHLDIKMDDNKLASSFLQRQIHQKQFEAKYKKLIEGILKEQPQDFVISMMKGAEFDFLPSLNDGSFKIAECHYATQFYDSFYEYNGANFLKSYWRKYQRKKFENVLSHYDKVVVLTKADENNWANFLNNLSQIYNPVAIEVNQLPKYDTPSVIAVGRFSTEKGYEDLVTIWSEIPKDFPEWTLNIYGSGPEKNKIEQLINSLNLSSSIKLHDAYTPIAEKLLASSVFAMTSNKEGMGLALVEAMTCSLPVIAFDCPNGPKEIIDDNRNGFLVPDFDKNKYIQGLKELLKDESLRQRLGANAQQKAMSFTNTVIMQNWDKLFKSLK